MLPGVLDGLVITGDLSPGLAAPVFAEHMALLGAALDLDRSRERNRCRRGTTLTVAGAAGRDPIVCGIGWMPPGSAEMACGCEAEVQALCGLMEVNGRDHLRPRRLGLDVASVCAGVCAVQGVLAAILARRRGRGQSRVDTSVLQGGLWAIAHHIAYATCGDDWMVPADADAAGPPFRTADGHWVEIEALTMPAWRGFWTGLGVTDAGLDVAALLFVLRYTTARCSLPSELHEAIGRHTLAQVRRAAAASGTSVCTLRRHADLRSEGGWDRAPWRILPASAAPAATAHGVSPAGSGATDAMRSTDDGPLTGLRVVEATSRLQGPLAGLLLRMLGAEVTRVEPPGGDAGRIAPPRAGTDGAFFVTYNHGKTSVEIDHHTAGGRDALEELAAGADVFLHNWKPGRAESLGLGAERARARHPSVVWAHASGWGGAGPPGVELGTEYLVQAHAACGEGLQPVDEPPFPTRVTILDVIGGLLACEGVLAGLLIRETTGRGCSIDTSLLGAAMTVQREALDLAARGAGAIAGAARLRAPARRSSLRVDGRPRWRPLDRPVEAADGWMLLCTPRGVDTERAVMLCGTTATGADKASDVLAARLRAHTVADWTSRLAEAGIRVTPVCTDLADLVSAPWADGALMRLPEACVVPAPPWRFAA